MLELMIPLLAEGAKEVFENPSYLLGIPLLILGVVGILIVLSPVEVPWPAEQEYTEQELLPPHADHPTAQVYIQVGGILAVITAIEVAIYYVDLVHGVLVGVLLALSFMKFVMVVLWFMHLRFDNRLFSIFFAGALVLVACLFVVVLASLGASLV